MASGQPCPSDGELATRKAPRARRQPPEIEGYRVGKMLGSGGFAGVWSAIRTSDGASVAIKHIAEPSELDRERLEAEQRALRRVGPPWVPKVYEAGHTAAGGSYLVIERITQKTLAAHLEGDRRHRHDRAVCDAILAAVSAVHRRGVVHRDLKPENIFVCPRGKSAQLIDFGLATTSENTKRITRSGVVVGTVEYMAPEQIAGETSDEQTDIYALGAIIYEIVALRPPFVGDVSEIEHGHTAMRPPRPAQFRELPQGVESLILRCLAKEPSDRPASVAELRRDLERAWSTRVATTRGATTTLLSGAQEPALLLVVDADELAVVDDVIRSSGGFIARRSASRFTCVFGGFRNSDPVQATYAAAAQLMDVGADRVIMHLASVSIRQRRRGPPIVTSPAVDHPESWLPKNNWDGILMTSALGVVSSIDSRPSASSAGFLRPTDRMNLGNSVTLRGRRGVLAGVTKALEELASSGCRIATIIGEPGSGKSRVAGEVEKLLCERVGEPRVIALRAGTTTADKELALALDCSDVRAIIIDDAHRLPPDTLDAIESRTLERSGAPVLIVVIGDGGLEETRPNWGMRARRHDRFVLHALDEVQMMSIAAELLQPAEFPPSAFLRRLADWSRGNPAAMVGIVSHLKRQGIVRRREHGDGWFVATGEFSKLPAAPAAQWIANRDLSSMTPALAACARVCAVLGETFHRDELAAVIEAAESAGMPATPIDPGVGVARLVERGVLTSLGEGNFDFVSSTYQGAIYDSLDASDRRGLHDAAAQMWQERVSAQPGEDLDALARLARHAAESGRAAEAATAFGLLGERALERHQHVEADKHLSAALEHADTASARLEFLTARARARGLMHQTGAALADARAGQALAAELADEVALVDLLLIDAMIEDSAGNVEASAQKARVAREALSPATPSGVEARVAHAEGRAAWRVGDTAVAIAKLERATAARVDSETRIHAMLLLAPALVATGDLARAEAVFADVINLCQKVGDKLHECAAYGNRIYLWAAREQIDQAVEDLSRSIDIARELGNPEPERVATHNLSELLFWSGELDEALPLARRGRQLQQRFFGQVPHDALLLARIQAARGERTDAEELVRWIEKECDPSHFDTTIELLMTAVKSVLVGRPIADWQDFALRADDELADEEWLEFMFWRITAALDVRETRVAGELIADSAGRLQKVSLWNRHFESLRDRLIELSALVAPSPTGEEPPGGGRAPAFKAGDWRESATAPNSRG